MRRRNRRRWWASKKRHEIRTTPIMQCLVCRSYAIDFAAGKCLWCGELNWTSRPYGTRNTFIAELAKTMWGLLPVGQ